MPVQLFSARRFIWMQIIVRDAQDLGRSLAARELVDEKSARSEVPGCARNQQYEMRSDTRSERIRLGERPLLSQACPQCTEFLHAAALMSNRHARCDG
jgi:hypothetical protein